ncbi:DUF2589 domain-containing protein [Elizabethkingia bruuniana]|nr:DUF2589 domain-containing protein [Elizabethkingia bruuniana]QDZ61906.1 DUF2589 domain-containing protein [Elizabethkingia bruuniana]
MVNLKNLIEALNDSISIANDTLLSSHNDFINAYFEQSENGGLIAKTVSLNYPVKMGDSSIKNVAVNTPIITLIPVYSPKIDEVKLTTNLEIALDNNELLVSFSNDELKAGNLFGKNGNLLQQNLKSF